MFRNYLARDDGPAATTALIKSLPAEPADEVEIEGPTGAQAVPGTETTTGRGGSERSGVGRTE